jgi:neutral ceramidase
MERRTFLQTVGAAIVPLIPSRPDGWRAGVASIDITPRVSMWMAGFAARKRPSQGIALPLHAKALALEDARGRLAVLVTLDLLGVTADMTARIAAAAARRYRLRRDRLLLAASHTHCGPVTDGMLSVAYDLSAEQQGTIHAYTQQLEPRLVDLIGAPRLVDLIGAATRGLAPATLFAGESTADFAANRRVQFSPDGPVDHRVPILRVDVGGTPRAIVFGYACHNTTLRDDEVEFHGDYAGVAQAAIEARHPGAVALFIAGCGADANPSPRGTRALVNQHGEALAAAVESGLSRASSIGGPLSTAFDQVDLPFAPAPDRAEWRRRSTADDVYVRRHATLMLETLDREGRLPASQPEPVQVWRFGRGVAIVALGGEVVVDYALRLQREYPGERLWAASYTNDVFGYVPSRRVLMEGGYEGGGAMIYYGRPGPFDATVEDRIFAGVHRLLRRTSMGPPKIAQASAARERTAIATRTPREAGLKACTAL